MEWLRLIRSAAGGQVRLAQPATSTQLADVEASLRVVLPTALKELLLQTNGAEFPNGASVLSTDDMTRENLTMRTTAGFRELYWPFDDIVFFASEGNGDLFGFKALGGNAENWCFSVYEWDHETDSRTLVGGHLHVFLEQWVRGLAQD